MRRVKYLFTLETPFVFDHPLFHKVNFDSDWCNIQQGAIIIPANYSWDGCTPKFKFLGRIFGTPDGPIDPKTGKPITYYASLVHDVLYQYFGKHGISRKDIDQLFFEMLSEAGFKNARLYYLAVKTFGGIFIRLTR